MEKKDYNTDEDFFRSSEKKDKFELLKDKAVEKMILESYEKEVEVLKVTNVMNISEGKKAISTAECAAIINYTAEEDRAYLLMSLKADGFVVVETQHLASEEVKKVKHDFYFFPMLVYYLTRKGRNIAVDACYLKLTKEAIIAGLERDDVGNEKYRFSEVKKECLGVVHAELSAILRGLRQVSMGNKEEWVTIQSDSHRAVKIALGDHQIGMVNEDDVWEIRSIMQKLRDDGFQVCILHVYGERNQVADAIAKMARTLRLKRLKLEEIHDEYDDTEIGQLKKLNEEKRIQQYYKSQNEVIKKLIFNDMVGKKYLRIFYPVRHSKKGKGGNDGDDDPKKGGDHHPNQDGDVGNEMKNELEIEQGRALSTMVSLIDKFQAYSNLRLMRLQQEFDRAVSTGHRRVFDDHHPKQEGALGNEMKKHPEIQQDPALSTTILPINKFQAYSNLRLMGLQHGGLFSWIGRSFLLKRTRLGRLCFI